MILQYGYPWHIMTYKKDFFASFEQFLRSSTLYSHSISRKKNFTCAKGTKFSPPILPPRYTEQWCQ